jgi:hypothetical protein
MTTALAIHDPNCSTWDTPAESAADHLVAIGYHDERIAAYLSTLRPVYDAMKRCLGQMAGLLLLLQTHCLDPHRAGVTHDAMREILVELSDRLRALKAPEGAQLHFRGLEDLVRQLEAGAEQLNRQKDLIDPPSADLDALVRRLFAIQHGLLVAAESRAGLSPVDFTADSGSELRYDVSRSIPGLAILVHWSAAALRGSGLFAGSTSIKSGS